MSKKRKINKEPFSDIPIPVDESIACYKKCYFNYIKNDPELLMIYQKWIISGGILINDNWLYGLRDKLFLNEKKVEIPIFYFLFDLLKKFILSVAMQGLIYYGKIKPSENSNVFRKRDDLKRAMFSAFKISMECCDKKNVREQGFSNFIIAITEYFKSAFYIVLGIKHLDICPSKDDKKFIENFNKEWKKLYQFSDNFYGFDVIPALNIENFLRYLQIPFKKTSDLKNLSKTKIYKEIMNHVVSVATIKPMSDIRIKIYYREQLANLFMPLAKKLCKKTKKKESCNLSEENLMAVIKNEINNFIKDFQFCYLSTEKLKKGENFNFKSLIAPIGYGKQLVNLGHIFDNKEYPLTAYLEIKLKRRINLYIQDDTKNFNHISLDKEIENKDGSKTSRLDSISNEDINNDKAYIPDYDAKDAYNNILGWKIRTFSGIIEKSVDTLRRWEKLELIKPKRYEIYSPIQHKKIYYRAYTKDHIKQAKNISNIMDKRKRHQT